MHCLDLSGCLSSFLRQTPAFRAEPLHHTVDFLDLEILGKGNAGRGYILDTESPVAGGAGEVNVGGMVGRAAGTETVKLGAAAVVHFVEDVVLLEEGQSTEEGGFVHGIQPLLHLGKVECTVNAYYLPED